MRERACLSMWYACAVVVAVVSVWGRSPIETRRIADRTRHILCSLSRPKSARERSTGPRRVAMAFGERPAGFGFAEGTWRRHLLQHGMVLLAALRHAHSARPFLDLANRLRTQAIAAARLAFSCDTAGKSRARRWCWRSVGVGRAGGRPDRQHLWQVWKGGCNGYLFDHRVHLLLHMVDVAFNNDVRLVELVDLRTANQRALQTLLFARQTHSYPVSTSALIPWPLSHAEPLRCSRRHRRKAVPAARHLPIERAQRRVVGRLASQPRYLAGSSLSLAEE